MKPIKDTMLYVRITKELARKFKVMCLLNDQTQTDVINEILEQYIDTCNKQNIDGLIKRGK